MVRQADNGVKTVSVTAMEYKAYPLADMINDLLLSSGNLKSSIS